MSTNCLTLLSSLHHQVLPMPKRTNVLIGTGYTKELVQVTFYITCNWLLHFHDLLFLLQFSTIFAQFANFSSEVKVLQHFTSSSVSKSNINLAGCNAYGNEKFGRHSVVINQDTLESKNISNCVEVIRITVGPVRVCCTWCIFSEAL